MAIRALNRDATNERKELEALKEQVNLIKLQLPLKSIKQDTIYLLKKDFLKISKQWLIKADTSNLHLFTRF